MNYLKKSAMLLAAAVLGLPAAAVQAKDEVKDVVICAVTEVHACELYQGCRKVQPEEANAPDFLKVDLKKMELTGRRYDGTYATVKIATKTQLPKLTLLQGVNSDSEALVDGLAFSMAIHVDTGRMSASATTTETVLSLLGTCHAL